MSLDSRLQDAAKMLVEAVFKTVDANLPAEIAQIVKLHSVGAATAGLAAGWVPGGAGLAAAAVSAGFIWSMYGRINAAIGLSISDNVVKSLGSGIATNLAAYFIGGAIVSGVASLFPGIGTAAAMAVVGATAFALTAASGYVYLQLLTQLYNSGRDPSRMNADELKRAADNTVARSDVKSVIDDAKSQYKR